MDLEPSMTRSEAGSERSGEALSMEVEAHLKMHRRRVCEVVGPEE